MKTYKIYDMNTDEEITEIRAFSVVEAERKFLRTAQNTEATTFTH